MDDLVRRENSAGCFLEKPDYKSSGHTAAEGTLIDYSGQVPPRRRTPVTLNQYVVAIFLTTNRQSDRG